MLASVLVVVGQVGLSCSLLASLYVKAGTFVNSATVHGAHSARQLLKQMSTHRLI